MRRLKVYLIARVSVDAHEHNNRICSYLDERIDIFKPQSIIPMGLKHEEFQRTVFQACMDRIRRSDVGLLVAPYGNDCSWEVGYYSNSNKLIVAYVEDDILFLKDWMIKGGLDFVITSSKLSSEKLKKDPILYDKVVLLGSTEDLSNKLFELCWSKRNGKE